MFSTEKDEGVSSEEEQTNVERKKPSSIAQNVYSFVRPSFLQKKINAKKIATAESRVTSMHERIQMEMDMMNDNDAVNGYVDIEEDSSTTVKESIKSVKTAPVNVSSKTIEKKKKAPGNSKPKKAKVDILQKSEKKKQLEAFEAERIAKAKEKKRVDRIEKEAKREVLCRPPSICFFSYSTTGFNSVLIDFIAY